MMTMRRRRTRRRRGRRRRGGGEGGGALNIASLDQVIWKHTQLCMVNKTHIGDTDTEDDDDNDDDANADDVLDMASSSQII